MSLLRHKKPTLSRTNAMSCRPVKLPIVARSDLDGDRARVTVELARAVVEMQETAAAGPEKQGVLDRVEEGLRQLQAWRHAGCPRLDRFVVGDPARS